MQESVAKLNGAQLAVSEGRMAQNVTQKNVVQPRINLVNLLEDGTIKNTSVDINQGYYIYLGHAVRLLDLNYTEFYDGNQLTQAQISLFYLKESGLEVLRNMSERVSIFYTNYYLSRTEVFSKFDLVTMILGITFIVLAQLIIVPKIFSVNTTNMKVLSLFGYILPQEVQKLADQCENYIYTYLDELALKEDSSYLESDDELQQLTQQPQTQTQNLEKEMRRRLSNVRDESGHQDFTLQMKEFSESEDLPGIKVLSPKSLPTSAREYGQTLEGALKTSAREENPLIFKGLEEKKKENEKEQEKQKEKKDHKEGKEENDDKEEDEEYQEYLHERSKKLRKSRNHKKHVVISQISTFALLFIAYFVVDYVLELAFLRDYKKVLVHLGHICRRLPDIKYIHTFTIEELTADDPYYVYPNIPAGQILTNNYRTQYSDLIYSDQALVRTALTQKYPGAFDDYFSLLREISYGNICQIYFSKDPVELAACEGPAEGVMTRGLVQTEISYIEMSKKLVTGLYNTPNRDITTRKFFINNDEVLSVVTLLRHVAETQRHLTEFFMEAGNSYIDGIFRIQQIRFAAFLLALSLVLVFIMLPYLRKLTRQIYRTKALLNMIPMVMLKKNKTLKEIFTSNEITQALK